jgi:glycosyltransferase involved in cell wall biosynthesis
MVGKDIEGTNAVLKGWIDEAGITDVVHLLGQRSDMPVVTAALDVAVNASLGEGFPNAVGEAMACAVPCVVTDVGDCADIVGATGHVVPAGDSGLLAAHVLQLLAMPAEERARLGQAARRRVAEHYEIGDVVRRYEAFYSAIEKGLK